MCIQYCDGKFVILLVEVVEFVCFGCGKSLVEELFFFFFFINQLKYCARFSFLRICPCSACWFILYRFFRRCQISNRRSMAIIIKIWPKSSNISDRIIYIHIHIFDSNIKKILPKNLKILHISTCKIHSFIQLSLLILL